MDWTERMIRMRKEVPEIGWGDFSILGTGKPEVLALRYDWRKNSVLFVHNLSPIPTEVKFGAGAKVDGQLVNLLSNDHSTPDASNKHRILLEPYGYRWFRIGGLDYLLKRTEI
jgi:maltose alpha-D-glucosyltransferase/alpha-amylase